jgi:hypothetical protein
MSEASVGILEQIMKALTLFIIRHAEKPDTTQPALGPGLMEDGTEDTESLVIRGWQRAGAWDSLFGAGLGGKDYLPPDKIYAATPGAAGDPNDGPSRRPAETISVLAARLGLNADESIPKGKEGHLVKKLMEHDGVVLVCWEHKAIVEDILPGLPVSNRDDLPAKWSGDRFDVVLRFDRAEDAQSMVFKPLYPRLLPGDSDKPVDHSL